MGEDVRWESDENILYFRGLECRNVVLCHTHFNESRVNINASALHVGLRTVCYGYNNR
jgi:hypothetical protein